MKNRSDEPNQNVRVIVNNGARPKNFRKHLSYTRRSALSDAAVKDLSFYVENVLFTDEEGRLRFEELQTHFRNGKESSKVVAQMFF